MVTCALAGFNVNQCVRHFASAREPPHPARLLAPPAGGRSVEASAGVGGVAHAPVAPDPRAPHPTQCTRVSDSNSSVTLEL